MIAMKKFKKNIGLVLSVGGMFLTIATADGSNYEILLRLIGVAMFTLGAYFAQMFDFQSEGVNHEDENKDKHIQGGC